MLRALRTGPDCDPFRALHHAVEAGDDGAVLVHGEAAAREASRVGAHRQVLPPATPRSWPAGTS